MKKKCAVILAVLAAGFLCGFIISDIVNKEYSKNGIAMDTTVCVKMNGGSQELCDEMLNSISNIEINCLSRTSESSEVYRINSLHELEDVSDCTLDAIETAMEINEKSSGALDITLGAVSDLWNFKAEQPKVPYAEDIETALYLSGSDKLKLDGDDITLVPGAVLDLGAVGKGVACNEVRKLLEKSEAKSAIVSIGGSVMLYGKREYTVGIRLPLGQPSQYAGTLKLRDTCVSTSGSYERGFVADGVRYHHILNPSNGYPVQNGLLSATVVCSDGTLSDALSTACFALGADKGAALAKEFDAQAVFITESNVVYYTEGLKDSFTLDESTGCTDGGVIG